MSVVASSVDAEGGGASAWRVSRLRRPVPARRRPVAMIITPASTSTAARATTRAVDESTGSYTYSYSSKKIPSFQGNTKLNPGPRKNEPMMTSTAHSITNIVKIEIANFRSFGSWDGLLST